MVIWLVVEKRLWTIWVRHLGWWQSQYMENMSQTSTNQWFYFTRESRRVFPLSISGVAGVAVKSVSIETRVDMRWGIPKSDLHSQREHVAQLPRNWMEFGPVPTWPTLINTFWFHHDDVMEKSPFSIIFHGKTHYFIYFEWVIFQQAMFDDTRG